MKDYSAMSDAEVNIEVAEIQYPESQKLTPYKHRPDAYIYHLNGTYENKDYCNNPTDAWPIVIVNGISLMFDGEWQACVNLTMDNGGLCEWDYYCSDANPLRAAMIVYLQMMDAKS